MLSILPAHPSLLSCYLSASGPTSFPAWGNWSSVPHILFSQKKSRSYLGPLDIEAPQGYNGPFDIERFRYSAEEYFISVVDGSGARIRYDNGALVMGTRDHTFKKIVQADFQAEDS